VLKQLNPGAVEVGIYLVALPEETKGRESELDEMWSYVGKKDNPRWLCRVSARKSVAFYAIEVTQMLIPEAYSCYP